MAAVCRLEECGREVGRSAGYGYCRPHYRAFAKHGDPRKRFGEKVCADCGVTFEPTHGAHITCAVCRPKRLERKAREYRRAHRDKIIQYNRDWRAKNPGYHAEYNKRWREKHPEEAAAYMRQYRVDNLDAVRQRFRDWEAKNPDHAIQWVRNNRERARETTRRRRARLKGVPEFVVTDRDIRRLLDRFRHRCAYCEASLRDGYHVDHVVPVSLGGPNGIGNLVPACSSCNSSKSNWLLSEWRYRDRLSNPLRRRRPTHLRAV